ncbi:MAG: MBL fold metallo-hydrolase [Candidatus Uhrbacteria bacterium]
MQVTTFGTRGSTPVAGEQYAEFGGNTTCLRVHSACLPEGVALIVDAGSGYRSCTGALLKEGIRRIGLLHTHYHWDHVQGLPFGAHTYVPGCTTMIWGPKEHGVGPLEVYQTQMDEPYFPVNFERVRHQFGFHSLEHIGTQVLVFHPIGGAKLERIHAFRERDVEGGQLVFPKNAFGRPGSYPVAECLVVWMYKTAHPEYTVSFRFEERSTGKVFVFLTDHEVTPGDAVDLRTHLRGADLLIQDAQYGHDEYLRSRVGWGHGTPVYAAETAARAGVRRLGITHHDPTASDADVRKRLEETRMQLVTLGKPDLAETAFACKDYATIEV